jgi:hypothetical protein
MTRIIHGAGVGITHGAGDGLSEFPSGLVDAGTAGSAAAFSVQASDASALITLACSIRGSDASALPMRVLVAVSAAAVADSMINMPVPRGDLRQKDMIELSLTRAVLPRGSDARPNGGIPIQTGKSRQLLRTTGVEA